MAGYIGSKAVFLSTTTASVGGDSTVGGDLTVDTDTLYVDSANNRVGIGTDVPSEKLEVSGNISVNTSGNPSMTVKTSGAGNNPIYRLQADTNYWDLQGTFSNANDELFFMYNGSVKMGIDSSGRVTLPYQPAFRVTAGAQNTGSGDIVFTSADFDIGGGYNTSTGRFTAPVGGVYLFYITALYTTGGQSPTWKVGWYKNGAFQAVAGEWQSTFNSASNYHTVFNSTVTIQMSSGDYVNLSNIGTGGVHISGTQTKFGGYLLG